MVSSRRVILGATARSVWIGLEPNVQNELTSVLRALVANPVPSDAISISNELPRYRLQVGDLTVGYEFDEAQNLVIVKAILPDIGGVTNDARMLELMSSMMRSGR